MNLISSGTKANQTSICQFLNTLANLHSNQASTANAVLLAFGFLDCKI